jgi:hypothetical protein
MRGIEIIKRLAILLILLAFAGYAYVWRHIADRIDQQIDIAWSDAESFGIVITGEKPQVYGFPFFPTISFQGTVTGPAQTTLTIPEAILRGFPVQGFPVKMEMPSGLTINSPGFLQPIVVTEARFRIQLPFNLPRSFNQADLKAWQATGEHIPIKELHIKSSLLSIDGEGYIGLDDKLEISGLITSRVAGMDALLADMTEKGVIKGKSAVMAQSFLQMLIQRDPVTGETFFVTGIRIQNRGVFLGPLRVASLPEPHWNSDNQPVRRQLPAVE